MKETYFGLGLMSGTSMDGVDLSLIKTDGYDYFAQISNKYFEFNDQLYNDLVKLRENIKNSHDLKKNSSFVRYIDIILVF